MNHKNRVGILCATCTLIIAVAVPNAFAFEFIPLGDLSGGSYFTMPRAISGDGRIVVGQASADEGLTAFRWTRESGIVSLGDLGGGDVNSLAHAISEDGLTVVGYGTTSNGREAFRWTEQHGMLSLQDPGNLSVEFVEAHSVSANGSTIVGGNIAGDNAAIRWTAQTGAVALPFPQVGLWEYSRATDISIDGSTIVGAVTDAEGSKVSNAILWRDRGTSEFLIDLGPDSHHSEATGTSKNGSFVAGLSCDRQDICEAFRWAEMEGVMFLGVPKGFDINTDGSTALGISADGATIVGFVGDSEKVTAIWSQNFGWRLVEDILNAQDIELDGWKLSQVLAISADGRSIVGVGSNPDGNFEGWLAVITVPEPGSLVLCAVLTLYVVLHYRDPVARP